MGLSIEPKTKKRPVIVVGTIVLIVLIGTLWWQGSNPGSRGNNSIETQLSNSIKTQGDTSEVLSANLKPSKVELVYSAVIEPQSDAFTAQLYLEEAEHSDNPSWDTVGGRTRIETYIVQPGDTLWGIATQFGLSLDTLRWSNPKLEQNPDILDTDTELIILPLDGVYHIVGDGETIDSIAQTYGVASIDIINYPLNKLSAPYDLNIDDKLIIPNGRKDINIPKPDLDRDYLLAWPILGRVTQDYHTNHRGIDIGSIYGAEVYASDAGTVVYAQWARTGYGYTVIIAHEDNRYTLYSHLKGAWVRSGQPVARGDIIGAVGSTGKSTGPHVHFEVREEQERVDPLDYLRPR